MTPEQLKFIRDVERKRYPEHMWGMQYITRLEHIQWYAGSETLKIIITPKLYAIFTEDAIIDLAADCNLKMRFIREEYLDEKQWLGDKVVNLSARNDTSYKLIIYGVRRKKIKIHSKYKTTWGGVLMYDMEISFI
jgi:hypothetical protein